ncbi:MAG TPA: MerR family transcriptional regulator [Terriglobales bacterium]|nr:MerR family transcriptional regulator [Terriglobales bacterium]
MKIGELARRSGASVQAIRFYERRRLIRTPRRTPAGYRIYTDKDLEVVTIIKKMQRFGFALAEIRRVLQLWVLPSDTGASALYHEGSQECRREALTLGQKKLEAMNKEIQSAIQVRDELENALSQIRAGLDVPLPPKVSPATKASSLRRKSSVSSIAAS